MEQKSGAATASTILGIVSLALAVIGGITFGVIGAGIALVLGVVAIVLGINAKKETNGTKGQTGFVCGLIGLIFAVIFAAGCAICGAAESTTTKTSYTCYGCVGGSCMASRDLDNAVDDVNDALDQLRDMY